MALQSPQKHKRSQASATSPPSFPKHEPLLAQNPYLPLGSQFRPSASPTWSYSRPSLVAAQSSHEQPHMPSQPHAALDLTAIDDCAPAYVAANPCAPQIPLVPVPKHPYPAKPMDAPPAAVPGSQHVFHQHVQAPVPPQLWPLVGHALYAGQTEPLPIAHVRGRRNVTVPDLCTSSSACSRRCGACWAAAADRP